MKLKYISPVGVFAALAAAGVADAQVVVVIPETVNQIQGAVAFTNTDFPEALASTSISTSSIGLGSTFTASTSGAIQGANAANYSVTVLADGTTHGVAVSARFDGGSDVYHFESQVSDPVPDQPGAPPVLNFEECAGFVRVNFVDHLTDEPRSVQSMSSTSRSETASGSGVFGDEQASTSKTSTSSEIYPVRGDGLLHEIRVGYRVSDITYATTQERVVDCGETVEVEVRLGNEPHIDRGGIRGYISLDWEHEKPNTVVYATNGPFDDGGSATITSDPARGHFQIDNLWPSAWEDIFKPYHVYGTMQFDVSTGGPVPQLVEEWFRTPRVSVEVPAGGYAYLNNTYRMRAGYVRGAINVTGPDVCVNMLSNGASSVRKYVDGIAGTASEYGHGWVPVLGEVKQVAENRASYSAPYHLSVGTPDNQPGPWQPSFRPTFVNAENSNLKSAYDFRNAVIGAPVVNSGGPAVNVPVNHCLAAVYGDVRVNSQIPGGTGFNNPRVSYNGGLQRGSVHYTVSGSATGSPDKDGEIANSGEVKMCIPEGGYLFDTTVDAYDAAGVPSTTQLRSVNAHFNCNALVNPYYFDIEVTPACAGQQHVPFDIAASTFLSGTPTPARSAWAVVNGDVENRIPLCGLACAGQAGCNASCGSDPKLNLDLPTDDLRLCANNIEVFVQEDIDGRISRSGDQSFVYEGEDISALQCQDVQLPFVPGGSELDLMSALSINPCRLDMEVAFCQIVSDRDDMVVNLNETSSVRLGAGVHEVYCSMNMECGSPRACSFNVTVGN